MKTYSLQIEEIPIYYDEKKDEYAQYQLMFENYPKLVWLANEYINLKTFNWQEELINFAVEEGDVIIFPAYLRHKASVNEALETKVILSFNLNYR